MQVRRPVLVGPSVLIAPKPDLRPLGIGPGPEPDRANEPNDHTLFRDAGGSWHLWACVRNTALGRLLVHWTSPRFADAPWRLDGEVIRADRAAGESRMEWKGQEFIQSPFVVREGGRWWMFYGGYATGHDPDGRPTEDYNLMENQISLMTSPDGGRWTRHRDADGLSRVFEGPGAVRDPFFGQFGDLWYCYYAGHHGRDRTKAGIYVRTSKDLVAWSDWRIAQFDTAHPGRKYEAESPFVVERHGIFYLFRTHGPDGPGTYVYWSRDPFDFGDGGDANLVCVLPVIAPEIVRDEEGTEHITNIHEPGEGYGIRHQRLEWQ